MHRIPRLSRLIIAGLGLALLPFQGQTHPAPPQPAAAAWRFAVSGDSRNCGDVVMPAIAAKVTADQAAFYWHLGDYRAIYDFDEDYRQTHPKSTVSQYMSQAWPDFIENQLRPFGKTPVYLSMGNHETIAPKTRALWLIQFADWLLRPDLKAQRLADDPSDHELRGYYHWLQGGVDFISLDNASKDMFDDPQMKWLKAVLDRAAKNPAVRSLVVGMHAALPDSLGAGHSMNESAQATVTGRAVYDQLLALRRATGKPVYVLASHSHFYMDQVYATPCRKKDEVLPGWIVGSAGAVRYRLPKDLGPSAEAVADTYGYLLGNVSDDGSIRFEFKSILEADVPKSVVDQFTPTFVHWCFTENKSGYVPEGPDCRPVNPAH